MEKHFVFISYARKNIEKVKEILNVLEANGIGTYIDFRDIPPGSVFAEEIVNAIEDSLCCVLMYTLESNKSGFVLNEMNSAVNHNKSIIPLRLDNTVPSKALEFYIGKTNWIDYTGDSSLEKLIKTIKNIGAQYNLDTFVRYQGPIVLNHEQLHDIGYTTEKIVMETIEIDYVTLGEAPTEYVMNEEIEGNLDDWFLYVRSYPETSSMIVVKDRIVGYYQMELLNDTHYHQVLSGEKMVHSDMEEFYGFGGEFNCYIAIMPILPKYETQSNYLLLLNDFFNKIARLYEEDIYLSQYGISVYTPLLEAIVKKLGFHYVGINPAGGKIYELTAKDIALNPIFKRKYPKFYEIYGGPHAKASEDHEG